MRQPSRSSAWFVVTVAAALTGMPPALAQERASSGEKPHTNGNSDDPFPIEGSPADICRWYEHQNRRLNDLEFRRQIEERERHARATGRPVNQGFCGGGGANFNRPEVLSPDQWCLLGARCVEALQNGTSAQAVEAFQALNGHVREALMTRPDLGKVLPADLPEAIIARAGDADVSVRRAAGWSLSKLGPGYTLTPPSKVPIVLAALEDPDEKVRYLAVSALSEARWGPSGAGSGLGHAGPSAAQALLRATTDASRTVAVSAILTLGNMGEEGRVAVPRLIELLEAPQHRLDRVATSALGSLGAHAADAVPALIKRLRNGNLDDRIGAAYALGRIGEPAASAVPDLISALSHPTLEFAAAAVFALGQLGPLAAEALPILMEAAERDSEAFGGEAAWAIKRVTGVE